MKKIICLVVAGIFLFGNTLTGQDQKKVYAPMPVPPRYLDSMLVSNGIMEIADRVYDNGWIDFKLSLEINLATLFEKYQKYFDFTEGNIMVLDTIIRDDKGYAYYHFHQEYQGIPLDNLDYIIQAKDGKAPFVVQMKRSGIFIVRAVNGDKTYKEPLTYAISNHEYFIEF